MNRNDNKRPQKTAQGNPATPAGKKTAPKTGQQSGQQPDRKQPKTTR
ncbi:hypothetical protein [Luteimonas suaedae]|nr:hypothetical protein [Luteimonas suaedae]